MRELDGEARSKGVILFNELGVDPGIDHMTAMQVIDRVHAEGGKICMQILHSGRYGYHPLTVAPSAIRSPITPFKPRALSDRGVRRQVRAFVRSARLARDAGYDGVEGGPLGMAEMLSIIRQIQVAGSELGEPCPALPGRDIGSEAAKNDQFEIAEKIVGVPGKAASRRSRT